MNIKEYKTASGTAGYIAKQAYIGTDSQTGKRIRKDIRGRTKSDIKIKYERLKREFEKNDKVDRKISIELFSEVAESWFEQYKLGVKIRSQEIMRTCLDFYLLPALGSYRIEKITPVMIQQQVNQWALTAAAPLNGRKSRPAGKGRDFKRYFDSLKRIFEYALSLGIITSNPCLNVQTPKVKLEKTKKDIQFYDNKQRHAFFKYLDTLPDSYTNNEFKIICRLLIASGLRIGEAMALSWSDIDLNAATLSVSKTMHITTIQDTPKTNSSNRLIHLDNQTISKLRKWWAYEQSYFLKIGNPNQKLVFPNSKGKPRDYQTLRPTLYKCIKGANVPNIGFHGFRHTHVSMLLNAGANFVDIQHRLGHATLAMTMDTYGHLEPEKEKETANIFEKVIDF
ncbi:tyrosine-type recombinase/integrase [Lactovum odontotermitis]